MAKMPRHITIKVRLKVEDLEVVQIIRRQERQKMMRKIRRFASLSSDELYKIDDVIAFLEKEDDDG